MRSRLMGSSISLGLLACAGGCASTPAAGRPAAAPAQAAAPLEREQWALPVWPGTTLVVPWSGQNLADANALRVTGAGGATLDSQCWRVWAEPDGASWSGPVGRWQAERIDPRDPGALASAREPSSQVMLAVEIPPDFFGEEIVVGGSRLRVLPSPSLADAAWISPMPAYADWPTLLEAARPDEANPMLRWRARLLRAGVPDDPTRPVSPLDNPLLEALAVQEELRWRTGLSKVHRADPALAARVRARILAVVESAESGLLLPLWSQDRRALDQLRDIVMDERAAGPTLASRVEGWLRRQPDAVAWFEHAFAQDTIGARAAFIRAWVGNPSSREVLAWMEFRAQRPSGGPVSEPILLAPGELRLLEAPVVLHDGPPETVPVEVHAGARLERGDVVIGALPAQPPAVTLGPLLPAHDAASVQGGDSTQVEGGICAAQLRRIDSTGLAPAPLTARGRWTMLLECAVAEGRGPGTITLDFAHEAGRTRVEVRADGSISVDAPAGLPVAGYPRSVPVARQAGVWTSEIPVPDWCVGLDGKLRVSLLRTGEAGGLWSWPTRVLRSAPDRGGRATIDLEAWDPPSSVARAPR